MPYENSGSTTTSISANICLPSLKEQTNTSGDHGETTSTHSSTLTTSLNKNHMRRNKKLNKTASNERTHDGSSNDAYSVYSSHYNEDVDKLLQFITSSTNNASSTSTTTTGSNNSSNKSKNKVSAQINFQYGFN